MALWPCLQVISQVGMEVQSRSTSVNVAADSSGRQCLSSFWMDVTQWGNVEIISCSLMQREIAFLIVHLYTD